MESGPLKPLGRKQWAPRFRFTHPASSFMGSRSLKTIMHVKLPRQCPECRKNFRPMTDAQWRIVGTEHGLMSLRHPEEARERFRKRLTSNETP